MSRAGPRPAGRAEQPAAAECRGAVGRHPGRPRAGDAPGQRPVQVGREPGSGEPQGQRPLLPPERHRHHHARLCRSAAADVPLQRPAGDRHRHRHEGQRQHPAVRQGPQGAHARDRRHAADRRRRASRLQPAGGRRGGGRRLHQGAVRGGRDRAGGELPEPRPARRPGGGHRHSRWCWPPPSSSWSIPASPCSASRSVR